MCDAGHTVWPGEHGGTLDALLVECREPASDASDRSGDRSRLRLRDTICVVVILSNLVAYGVRSFLQSVAVDLSIFRFRL
jgi:hypothetical protein